MQGKLAGYHVFILDGINAVQCVQVLNLYSILSSTPIQSMAQHACDALMLGSLHKH